MTSRKEDLQRVGRSRNPAKYWLEQGSIITRVDAAEYSHLRRILIGMVVTVHHTLLANVEHVKNLKKTSTGYPRENCKLHRALEFIRNPSGALR